LAALRLRSSRPSRTSPCVRCTRTAPMPLGVQSPVEVVVVGGEVEEAVAGVVEEDDALLAELLRREGLVDHGADRVAGLGGRHLSLGGGETHGSLGHIAL